MQKAQDKLKKELLEQVSKDVQNSQDPQKEAFKLVSQTFETYKIFESALKKPLDDELLKQKAQQKKNVQFADTIKAVKESDRSKSVENKINESDKQTFITEAKPIQQKDQKIIAESNKSSTKENKADKNVKKQPPIQTDKKQPIKQESKQPVKEVQGTKRASLNQQEQQQKLQQPVPIQAEIQQPQNHKQAHSESEGSSDYYDNQRKEKNHSHSCRKHSKDREMAQKYEEIILKNNESTQQLQLQINEYNIDKTKLMTENTKLNTLNGLLQQELKTVNQQLNQQKKQIEDLDKQIYEQKQSSRQELIILKDQLQESKFQCAELENRNGYLTKAKDTFEQNLKQFEQEVARLQKINMQQTSAASADKLAILEKDGTIERLQKTNHQISLDLDQINKQYKDVSEKHKSLLVAFNKLENERNQMSSELEFRKTDQQEYLNSLKDKISKLTSSKQAYDEEISKLTQQAQDAKAEKEQYKLQYEQLKILCSESDELRKRLKLKEVENEQLQCENDKLKWKVRKDPNGILSDLKIMKIQAEDPNAKVPLEQLSKLDNQIRQLQEENNKLTAENKQLLKQIQQTELYVQEVKSMFDRERAFLEEKVYNKEKEINDLIIKQRHEIVDLENKYQEIQRRNENENKGRQTHQQPSYVTYNQQSISQQSAQKPSPYSVPQLQAKIKSYI